MAIDDVSFYTVTGEEINRTSLVEQMINYYLLKLDAGETKVTDFNEGSEIRNLLEAIAVDMYILMQEQNELLAMGFVETADGEFLDKHGANPFINLPRDTGMEASGFVTFSISEAITTSTVIPEGTIVVNSDTGLEYATLNDATIDVNEDSVTVAIECLTSGADGNCGVGEIDEIEEIFADIPTLTVSNEDVISGGMDYEEDDEYRERLLNYIRYDDFGSLPYYTKLALQVDGVHDVLLKDDLEEIYTKIIVVNANVKPIPVSILSDVLETFTDTNNIVIGHKFNVEAPNYINVDLTIDLTVAVEIDEDIVKTLLTEIFNGGGSIGAGLEFEGLYMGQDLTAELLKSNIVLLDSIEAVRIYETGESTELDVIEVDEDEVCKLGEVTINQTVAE